MPHPPTHVKHQCGRSRHDSPKLRVDVIKNRQHFDHKEQSHHEDDGKKDRGVEHRAANGAHQPLLPIVIGRQGDEHIVKLAGAFSDLDHIGHIDWKEAVFAQGFTERLAPLQSIVSA
ncbi:hypothetical protein SDC9_56215 [bioreactor metagenome]|uniref:Uncharacterized protein n=1 Tax=bioreactor metagenome TaxID=1076179 RepID=A0A644X184_9ZZZZ